MGSSLGREGLHSPGPHVGRSQPLRRGRGAFGRRGLQGWPRQRHGLRHLRHPLRRVLPNWQLPRALSGVTKDGH